MESSGAQSCRASCLAFSRTRKGLVLIGEIVLCLLTLVCFAASHTGYLGLAVVELVVAILVLLAWSYHLPQRMQMLHWAWSDFTRCVIGAVLFLIFSLIVIISHYDGAGIVGGVFGLLAGILMGYDAYITFPLWQGHTAAPTESPGGA
ncbi:proteolipid protein 2 [Camarhynchus parvulus]|uniref:proteolipid protein 2 n=1 Tax=Geospiza parvula TaxID=87175 RepID=UPI001237C6D4|nr:proteolipid protein 2 [Camarhynchus parvulus]